LGHEHPSNAQYGSAVSWESFVRETIGTDQQKRAAEKSGLDQSAISRWLKTGKPGTAENVAAFARGYKRPVLEAFIAAGFITEREAKVRPAGKPDFSLLTNDELLELVRARMGERGEHGGDTAATNAPGSGPDNVRSLSKREQMQQMQTEAARDED
jgi:transcriptional regulator with XRE-family HTH domain